MIWKVFLGDKGYLREFNLCFVYDVCGGNGQCRMDTDVFILCDLYELSFFYLVRVSVVCRYYFVIQILIVFGVNLYEYWMYQESFEIFKS